jgi:hypothetical protein
MSVIFETLQKIKHSANRLEKEESPVSGKRRKSSSLKRAFLPFGVIAGIGVGLLVFFLWGSWERDRVSDGQGVRKDTVGQNTVTESRAIAEVSTQVPESPGLEGNVAPPPPPNLTAEQVKKGKLYLPPSTPVKEREVAQYLPPAEDEKNSLVLGGDKKELRYESPSNKQGGKSHSAQVPDPFAGTITPVKKYGEETAPTRIPEDARTGPTEGPPAVGGKREAAIAKTAEEEVKHAEQTQVDRKARVDIRTATLTRKPEKSSGQGEIPRAKDAEKAQMSAVDQNAHMSIMVARVQQAMRAGDEREVEDLLGTLESLKGKKDDYVMRLKAFWFLKQRRYSMARALLEELVSKNENDLEAGINLAILDVKTNHMEAARKRLKAMRRLHEENTVIPVILEKISK